MSFLFHSEAIGFAGVTLLLIAFFLNLFRLLKADSISYLALNLVGASLACASSYLIDFLPFVLLEGTWAIVAGVALARAVRARLKTQMAPLARSPHVHASPRTGRAGDGIRR